VTLRLLKMCGYALGRARMSKSKVDSIVAKRFDPFHGWVIGKLQGENIRTTLIERMQSCGALIWDSSDTVGLHRFAFLFELFEKKLIDIEGLNKLTPNDWHAIRATYEKRVNIETTDYLRSSAMHNERVSETTLEDTPYIPAVVAPLLNALNDKVIKGWSFKLADGKLVFYRNDWNEDEMKEGFETALAVINGVEGHGEIQFDLCEAVGQYYLFAVVSE